MILYEEIVELDWRKRSRTRRNGNSSRVVVANRTQQEGDAGLFAVRVRRHMVGARRGEEPEVLLIKTWCMSWYAAVLSIIHNIRGY